MQKTGPKSLPFYSSVLKTMNELGIPFLVGGGYALKRHTGTGRPTRDLDIFVLPTDVPRVLRLFEERGYRTELPFPHWLGKIYKGKAYVDVIFSSGNGIARVDESWFEHAVEDDVLGHRVKLSPAEEMIWSKAFVMERDRYDGADVAHLLLARGADLDWPRLLERFRNYPLVLLAHLTLFLFVFPSGAGKVPSWVWDELLAQLDRARHSVPPEERICRGTLLSREQYLEALARGYRDARLLPGGTMRPEDVLTWTRAAVEERKPA
jgi:putative nucleotidyltransferase-like protein